MFTENCLTYRKNEQKIDKIYLKSDENKVRNHFKKAV